MRHILFFLSAIGALSVSLGASVPFWDISPDVPSSKMNTIDNININNKHIHTLFKRINDEKVLFPLAERLQTHAVSAECRAAALEFTNNTLPDCEESFFFRDMYPEKLEAALCGENKCLDRIEAFFNACKSDVKHAVVGRPFNSYSIQFKAVKSLCPTAPGEVECFSGHNYVGRAYYIDKIFKNVPPSKSQMDYYCDIQCLPRHRKYHLALLQYFHYGNTDEYFGDDDDDAVCFKDSNDDYCYGPVFADLNSGTINPSKICTNACHRRVFMHQYIHFNSSRKDMGLVMQALCAKKDDDTYCANLFTQLGGIRTGSDPCESLSSDNPSCSAECRAQIESVVSKAGCCIATYGDILPNITRPGDGMVAGYARAGKMFVAAKEHCGINVTFDGTESCRNEGRLKGNVTLNEVTMAMIDRSREKYVTAFKFDLSTSTGIPEDDISVTSIKEITKENTTRRTKTPLALRTAVAFNYEIETSDKVAAASVEKIIAMQISQGTLELAVVNFLLAVDDPSVSGDVDRTFSNETPLSSFSPSPSNSAGSVASSYTGLGISIGIVIGLIAALL